jgi:O-antigen/teichoic acid export membrane protein
MSNLRKFSIDYIALMASMALYTLRPLVLIPVIIGHMGKANYGIWAQILTTSMFLAPLISLRLNDGLTRYLSGTNAGKHISGAFLMATLVVILGVGSTFIIGTFLSKPLAWLIYGDTELTSFLGPALAYSGSYALFIVAGAYLNTMQCQVSYAVHRSVLTIGDCLIVVFLVYFTDTDIAGCAYALAAWQTVLSIIILARMITQQGWARPTLTGMTGLWSFLFSLLISHLAFFTAGNANRYVLVNLMGLENLAVFQVALQIATVVSLVAAPNQYILIPSLAGHWNQNEKQEMRSLIRLALLLLVLFGLPCIAFVAQAGPFVINVLTGKVIQPPPLLLLMLATAVFLGSVFQVLAYSYHLTRQVWLILLPVAVSGAINVGLPFFLVPRFGLRGAAFAYLLSVLLLVVAAYPHSFRVFGTGPDWKQVAKAAVISVAIYLALWPICSLNMCNVSLLMISVTIAVLVWIVGIFTFKILPAGNFVLWIKQEMNQTLGLPTIKAGPISIKDNFSADGQR